MKKPTNNFRLFVQKKLSAVPFIRNCFFLLVFSLFKICPAQPLQIGDSITVALAPEYDSVGKGHRFWFGEGYRKLWAVPVQLKVFDFDKTKGGITFQKTGGGLQTKSLRYKDAAGKEWVLRSVQKYPERGLPVKLRKTILKKILHDQVITSHPYSAITVPPFAGALGILHSKPQYVFVPDDPALGAYREDFGNAVFLLEERAPDDTLTTDNTAKVQEKLKDDNDNRIDQKMVLRARLLDMLLGDWDRHEDQWRWQKRKEGTKTTYLPIPRDRDNVYYNTTGVLPWMVSHQWLMSRLQGFKESIRDVNGFNFNNQYFDRYFLNGLSKEDWEEQIAFVQKNISDDLIRTALLLMPQPVYALSGSKIEKILIARRDSLAELALSYYRFLSKYVDITTSDKHELFDVQYKQDGKVDVTIFKTKKNHAKEEVIFHREFDPAVTKEIRLYGLAGQDVFSASGTQSSPIKIRMIGGDDIDSFAINNKTKNAKRLFVYDRSDQVNMYPQSGARIKASVDSNMNRFDKRSFKYDRSGPILSLFINSDYGALTTVGWISEKQGFKKEPYASHQLFTANYSVARRSFTIRYEGDFKKVFGPYDFGVNILSQGPHNVSNFFGVGNETNFINPGKKGIEYYRNRYDLVNADVRIKRAISKNVSWSGGLAAQYYTSSLSNNTTRYLNNYNLLHPSEQVFSSRFYGGIGAGIHWQTAPANLLHKGGIHFITDIKALQQLSGERNSLGVISSVLSASFPISKDSGVVFMNRIGGGTTVGEPAYYQMMQLGGVQNLRGFNSRRFTGRSMFYYNAELSVKLFDFNSALFPGSVGLIGFNDVGRVWVPNEKSTQWHHGYGGGIYLAPADIVLLRAVVGHSVETTQLYLNVGVTF